MQLSFYPGPSQLYPRVEHYLTDAYQSGILSMNHRSEAFMDMLARTTTDLRRKLDTPPSYEVYFTSSATECWEIIAQSLVSERSYHVYNGAFGQKWFEYTRRLHPTSEALSFGLNEVPEPAFPERASPNDVLCLTHNETSNGTALPAGVLLSFRQTFPGIIAVDATSSMAGVQLPWEAADVWYASVQKCFGLPPGLGVLVVSPGAIAQAERVGERAHYNSLLFLRENFLKNQTPYTPNTLGIYLLGRVMQDAAPIETVDEQLRLRAQRLATYFEQASFELLVENPQVRSRTVLAIRANEKIIHHYKEAARQEKMLLGNGYGEWKNTTFRIANFPALTDEDMERLMQFFIRRAIPHFE
jgi:phosphoserine aminotransferase